VFRKFSMGDDINDILLEFRSLDPEPPEVREKCEKCRLLIYIWTALVGEVSTVKLSQFDVTCNL